MVFDILIILSQKPIMPRLVLLLLVQLRVLVSVAWCPLCASLLYTHTHTHTQTQTNITTPAPWLNLLICEAKRPKLDEEEEFQDFRLRGESLSVGIGWFVFFLVC